MKFDVKYWFIQKVSGIDEIHQGELPSGPKFHVKFNVYNWFLDIGCFQWALLWAKILAIDIVSQSRLNIVIKSQILM